MISVFDVEEVGAEVLVTELGIAEETAAKVIEVVSVKAKEVAEQQAKDKEATERRKREEEEAARRVLSGDVPAGDADPEMAAAAILGASSVPMPAAAPTSAGAVEDARAADILGQS